MRRSQWRVLTAEGYITRDAIATSRVDPIPVVKDLLAAEMERELRHLQGRVWVYTVGTPQLLPPRGPLVPIRQTARIYLPRRKLNVLRDRFSY